LERGFGKDERRTVGKDERRGLLYKVNVKGFWRG